MGQFVVNFNSKYKPLTAAANANPIPVFPDDGSMIV